MKLHQEEKIIGTLTTSIIAVITTLILFGDSAFVGYKSIFAALFLTAVSLGVRLGYCRLPRYKKNNKL